MPSDVADSQTDRLIAVDVLRGAALIAMLIAHAGPFLVEMPWAVKVLETSINDLASPLFALVMGMSTQLTWNRSTTASRTLLQQTVRGLLLVAFGILATTWGSWVAIVLQPLGVLLLVGGPLLLLRGRTLLIVAMLTVLISQPVVTAARAGAWWFFSHGPSVFALASWTVSDAHYRVISLMPFFLLGGLLVRRGLKRDRVMWVMAVIAPIAYLVAAVANVFGLATVSSGDYLDTLHDVGLVFAVYVVVVLVSTSMTKPAAKRMRDAIFAPFQAWGQVALSLYLLHVGVIALWNNAAGRPTENIYMGWLLIVPGMCLVAWLWWRFVGTGPVEWLMGWVTGRRKRWRLPEPQDRVAETTP